MSLLSLNADTQYHICTFLTPKELFRLSRCSSECYKRYTQGSELSERIWKDVFQRYISVMKEPPGDTGYYKEYLHMKRQYTDSFFHPYDYARRGYEKIFHRYYLTRWDGDKVDLLNCALSHGHLDLVLQYPDYIFDSVTVARAISSDHLHIAEYCLQHYRTIPCNGHLVNTVTLALLKRNDFRLLDACLDRGATCFSDIAIVAISVNRRDIFDRMLQRDLDEYFMVLEAIVKRNDGTFFRPMLEYLLKRPNISWDNVIHSTCTCAIRHTVSDCLEILVNSLSRIFPDVSLENIHSRLSNDYMSLAWSAIRSRQLRLLELVTTFLPPTREVYDDLIQSVTGPYYKFEMIVYLVDRYRNCLSKDDECQTM